MNDYVLKTDRNGNDITIRDVQLVLLDMAKDIDEICQRNNIPYFLNGGSALGAVRHKGFIPWDDDFDIAMMYTDYVRFRKALKAELPQDKYVYHCYEKDRRYNVTIPAMKIRRKGTYIQEKNTLLANRIKGHDGCDGVFIDVFVYDHCSKLKLLDLPYRLLNTFLMPFIILFDNLRMNPTFLKDWYVSNARAYGRLMKGTEYIGFDLTWTYKNPFKPFIFKKTDIYPVQYVDFEDTQFPIANDPDAFLRVAIAPSYMTLPPENERFAKHTVDIDLGDLYGK